MKNNHILKHILNYFACNSLVSLKFILRLTLLIFSCLIYIIIYYMFNLVFGKICWKIFLRKFIVVMVHARAQQEKFRVLKRNGRRFCRGWRRNLELSKRKWERKGGGKGDLQVNRSVIASTLFVIIKDGRKQWWQGRKKVVDVEKKKEISKSLNQPAKKKRHTCTLLS